MVRHEGTGGRAVAARAGAELPIGVPGRRLASPPASGRKGGRS